MKTPLGAGGSITTGELGALLPLLEDSGVTMDTIVPFSGKFLLNFGFNHELYPFFSCLLIIVSYHVELAEGSVK